MNGLTGDAMWLGCWLVFCRASQFSTVADDIRDVASKDPAHRKLFVRGLAWETSSQALREVSAWMACLNVRQEQKLESKSHQLRDQEIQI
jgi:hypothetical protein